MRNSNVPNLEYFDILIVEDDEALNDQMTELLSGHAYRVTQCFDGEEALNLAIAKSFDLILLDVMLPSRDGLSLLNILRSSIATPVIIVSAKHAEEERIKGLSAGADDYLAKPFNSQELILRIEAVLRRTRNTQVAKNKLLQIDGLIANSHQHDAYIDKIALELTPTEFGLLRSLIQNKGEVLQKPYLYQTILNRPFSQYDRSLDMHLSRIRRKLNNAGWDGSRLQTVHGKGYCLK